MDVLSHKNRLCAHRTSLALLFLFPGILLCGSPTASAQAIDNANQESEAPAPYVVFVAETSAFTRCGPGEEHYRTEPLRRGQELEVYVETGDGWLGVRPPEDSFCWMPADAVELSDDGKSATILEDKTVAWIGTRLGQARRYRWQVQLNSGEIVSILGQTERDGSSGTKTWYRIVPPSGEFRWIHRDRIVESAEALAERIAQQSNGKNAAGEIATVAMENQVAEFNPTDKSLVPMDDPFASRSESMAAQSLQQAATVPELRPAPAALDRDATTAPQRPRAEAADQAIQFHRGAEAEDFEDRGAVIGSGLKSEWKQESGETVEADLVTDAENRSILSADRLAELPSNGAAAAASAIAAPLKRMTDVVANFISPPRIVAIDSSTQFNAFNAASPSDRRWMVGSGRVGDSTYNPSPWAPPTSLGSIAPMNTTAPMNTAANVSTSSIMQTSALSAAPMAAPRAAPTRIVTIDQITRVEDAAEGADVDALGQILSTLMAEAASADEIAPLLRRTEALLQSGDVNIASQTRELLDLAQRYQNVAARRDGPTTIQASSLEIKTRPLVASSDRGGQNHASALGIPNSTTEQVDAADFGRARYASDLIQPLASTSQVPGTPQPHQAPLGPVTGSATGYLVQVYSSRANSPPYALTDDAGLTIAYVTPYPGVNLRNHLNSKIAVTGSEKLLEGMSTPHILVDRAIRR